MPEKTLFVTHGKQQLKVKRFEMLFILKFIVKFCFKVKD